MVRFIVLVRKLGLGLAFGAPRGSATVVTLTLIPICKFIFQRVNLSLLLLSCANYVDTNPEF